MTDVSAAAAALVSARREGRVMDELPGGMPANLDEAYAIQDGIVAGMGEAVAGWKVAFTNKPGQEKMGVPGPGAGPIFASYVLESPAKVAMPDPGLRISECEFAFRLKADLPSKDSDYTDDDIAAVVGSVHPAIEIVNRRLSSAIPMSGVVEHYDRRKAIRALSNGDVVIFAAGTGNPFFTTDSSACLRGIEVKADVVLKATKVDGVYSADPVTDPDAVKYDVLTYDEVLDKKLGVMDLTAICLVRDHDMPVRVFNMAQRGALLSIVRGGDEGTLIQA